MLSPALLLIGIALLFHFAKNKDGEEEISEARELDIGDHKIMMALGEAPDEFEERDPRVGAPFCKHHPKCDTMSDCELTSKIKEAVVKAKNDGTVNRDSSTWPDEIVRIEAAEHE